MLKPLAVSMAIGLAALAAPAYSMPYQVTDLGVLGQDGFYPRSISNSGVVLGGRSFSYSQDTNLVYERPAVWSGGSWLTMPDITGREGKDWTYFGFGINDLGQVAVTTGLTAADEEIQAGQWQGYIWNTRTQTVTALNIPQGNNGYGSEIAISGINNQGTVAGTMGSSAPGSYSYRAMTWSNGTYTDVSSGLRSGNSVAHQINGQGAVAGTIYDTNTDDSLALFYRNGSITSYFDLPQGRDDFDLMDMNDRGIVVFNVEGDCDANGCDRVGYIWNSLTGLFTIIPSTPGQWGSSANGINNLGQVVGRGMDGDRYTNWDSGLIWDPVKGIQSLNESLAPGENYWVWEGYDINDSGVILAVGASRANGTQGRLLLLTPVPEPETYALLLAGLGLVGFAARRRASL